MVHHVPYLFIYLFMYLFICLFIFRSMKGHFCEVMACAMRNVANCDMIGVVVVLRDNVDNHLKSGIWNDIDFNHSNCLLVQCSPIYFVFYHGCYWIATHCLQEPRSWVGIRLIDSNSCVRSKGQLAKYNIEGERRRSMTLRKAIACKIESR